MADPVPFGYRRLEAPNLPLIFLQSFFSSEHRARTSKRDRVSPPIILITGWRARLH